MSVSQPHSSDVRSPACDAPVVCMPWMSILTVTLAMFAVGCWVTPASAATVTASWEADSEPLGTGFGGNNWNGTAGTQTPHATAIRVNTPNVEAISAQGGTQTGYSQTIDFIANQNDSFNIAAWNGSYSPVSDKNNATFEFFLSPDSFSGNRAIFGTGGDGDGSGVALRGNSLIYGVNSANANPKINRTTSVDLDLVYDATSPNFGDYLRVRAMVHPSTTDGYIALSVENLGTNQTAFSYQEWRDNDWDGGDLGSIGYFAGSSFGGNRSNQMGPGPYDQFDGQIAALNFYNDQVVDEGILKFWRGDDSPGGNIGWQNSANWFADAAGSDGSATPATSGDIVVLHTNNVAGDRQDILQLNDFPSDVRGFLVLPGATFNATDSGSSAGTFEIREGGSNSKTLLKITDAVAIDFQSDGSVTNRILDFRADGSSGSHGTYDLAFTNPSGGIIDVEGATDLVKISFDVVNASGSEKTSIIKQGPGTVEITRPATYTGKTTIEEGTLRFKNGGIANIGGSGRDYQIDSGAILEFEVTSGLKNSGKAHFKGAGTLKKTGSATWQLTSADTTMQMAAGGKIDVTKGKFIFGGGSQGDWTGNLGDLNVASGATFEGASSHTIINRLTGAGIVTTGGGLTIGSNNGTATFSGQIVNDPNYPASPFVRKIGTGTQTLSGNNAFTGGLEILKGTVILGNSNSLAASNVLTFKDSSAGTLNIAGNNIEVSGLVSTGGAAGNSSVKNNSNSNATLTVNSNSNNTFAGKLLNGTGSGKLAVTKKGNGTLTLNAANTYTGKTTVEDGTLKLSNAAIVNTTRDYDVKSGAVLEFNNTSGGTLNSGKGKYTGAGIVRKAGTDTVQITSAGTTIEMSSGGKIDVTKGTYIFGAGGLGYWTNNKGDLNVAAGARFEGASSSTIVDVLTGAGTVTTGGKEAGKAGLTVGSDNGTGNFSGNIVNDTEGSVTKRSVRKLGTGTQTFSGNNTYIGETLVDAGTLRLDGTHVGGGAYTVASGATLGGTGTTDAVVGGDGVISPGASPGILTFGQLDPSGGLDLDFEFIQASSPNWNDAAASGNDVFRLTDATTPITSAMTSANEIDIFLNAADLAHKESFQGGIFTDLDEDFMSLIEDATTSIYVLGDGNGGDATFDGQNYYNLENYNIFDVDHPKGFRVDGSVVQVPFANFAGGSVNDGWVMQFDVTLVPEPTSVAIWTLLGLCLASYGIRRNASRKNVGRQQAKRSCGAVRGDA